MRSVHWFMAIWGLAWMGVFGLFAVQPLSLLFVILVFAWFLISLGTGQVFMDPVFGLTKTRDSGSLLLTGFGVGVLAPFVIKLFSGS